MAYDNWEEREKKFAPDALPTLLTRQIFVCYEISGSSAGKISIWDCDMSGEQRLLLCDLMVNIKIPAKQDLKGKVVEALENEIRKTRAESTKKINQLQERIDSLLCLEYRPDGAPVIDATANEIPF